jgi:hypothetical protein
MSRNRCGHGIEGIDVRGEKVINSWSTKPAKSTRQKTSLCRPHLKYICLSINLILYGLFFQRIYIPSYEACMEHTKLVTPSELEDFADRRDSEPVIPELVALLITRSVPDLTDYRIPYGDAIGLPGLDGLVRTEAGFVQFVPKKTSFWEIGRSENAQNKATEDYKKRTKHTPAPERANSTFVFVTPRSRDWDQLSQAAWIKRRRKDGWKDIKVIDGVQLCDWLREFPPLGKWLLQRIGSLKNLTGFQTPAEHWSHLARLVSKDDPALPPKIFLQGRENACQQLDRLFRHEAQQLILAIESENDAEDFVSAFIESLEEQTRRAYSNQCLFIADSDAWHTFANLRFSHILVSSPRHDGRSYGNAFGERQWCEGSSP